MLATLDEISYWGDPQNPNRPEITVNGIGPMYVLRYFPGVTNCLHVGCPNGPKRLLSIPDSERIVKRIRAGKRYFCIGAKHG